jgi:hypothetical protein
MCVDDVDFVELAQNVDTRRFPLKWQQLLDFTAEEPKVKSGQSSWAVPARVSKPSQYRFTPSIVDSTSRQLVEPAAFTKLAKGTYTFTFDQEVIGDIRLTASSQTPATVTVELGEQLEGGKARSKMGTGNTYREQWTFQGENVSFTGFGLRGFRYVTLTGYPGEVTQANFRDILQGAQTSIPIPEGVRAVLETDVSFSFNPSQFSCR